MVKRGRRILLRRRNYHSRRLRPHGDFAGHCRQSAREDQVRDGRTADTGRRGEDRRGRRDLGTRTQRDERLLAKGSRHHRGRRPLRRDCRGPGARPLTLLQQDRAIRHPSVTALEAAPGAG